MKVWLFISLFMAALSKAVAATEIVVTTWGDLQDALNSAQAGDTVFLDAATFNATSAVSWSAPANVTLKGRGTSAVGGQDQTVISDNYNAGSYLIQINAAATGTLRITGITVQSGTATNEKTGGKVQINTSGAKVIIDHSRFIQTDSTPHAVIRFGNGVFGVMYRCILDFTSTNALFFYNGRGADGQGNQEWANETAFGGADFFFIEDCQVNGNTGGATYDTRVIDGYTAARVVLRFNTVSQAVLVEDHATGHAPDDRGARAVEVYGNVVTSSLAKNPNFTAVDLKNGTKLVWGNSWDNVYKNIYYIVVTRQSNATYNQTATPNGWGYAGTEFNGVGSNWDGGTANGTDTLLGYPALDQPGRGQGQLLSGSFPSKVNSVTGTIFWPNQALEPIYLWNNTGGIVAGWGGSVNANNSGGRVVSNRDYYLPASGIQTNATTPFNGTTGVGWGTLANRPTTATAGVAYWATDQGSWNKSTANPEGIGVQMNGADGVLYKATATNTWTLYYEPYEYPHPLRGETAVTGAPVFRRGGKGQINRR